MKAAGPGVGAQRWVCGVDLTVLSTLLGFIRKCLQRKKSPALDKAEICLLP